MESGYSENITQRVFLYLLPAQYVAVITSMCSGVINGLLIGNFMDSMAMVALAFASSLTSIISAAAGLIAGGSRVICGRNIGKGETHKLAETYTTALFFTVVVGLVITFVCSGFSSSVAIVLGSTGDTTANTALYIKGLSVGVVPTMLVPVMMIFLQMVNEGNFSMTATIILVVSNILFSVLNIFVFKGGILGMALAASFAQYVALISIVVYIVVKTKDLRFRFNKLNLGIIPLLVYLGSPNAVSAFLYSFRGVVINSRALLYGGALAVNALAIMNSASIPICAFSGGLNNVSSILGSIFAGQKDKGSLRTLYVSMAKTGVVLLGVCALLVGVFGKQIVMLFGAEGALVKEAALLLTLYCCGLVVNVFVLGFISQFQALGRVMHTNLVYVFSAYIFPVAICILGGEMFGLRAVWCCFAGAEVLTVVIIYVLAELYKRKLLVSFDEVMDYDSILGSNEKFYITVCNEAEAVNVSEKIIDFLIDCGVEGRRARLCGLSVEEMACNSLSLNKEAVKNGRMYVNIFVGYNDDGSLSVLLKDTGKAFDITKQLQIHDESDPFKNIGIRMIYKLTDEVAYRNSFGLNVLSYRLS